MNFLNIEFYIISSQDQKYKKKLLSITFSISETKLQFKILSLNKCMKIPQTDVL